MDDLIVSWLLEFCRLALLIVFIVSAISKLTNVNSFVQAIAGFRILPIAMSRPFAFVFLSSEICAATSLFLGGTTLLLGFILALLLLTTFTVALTVALSRKVRVKCNCFGPAQSIITVFDVLRNIGFGTCAIIGLSILTFEAPTNRVNSIWELGLLTVMAVIYFVLLGNLADIAWLLQRGNKSNER